MGEQTDRGRKDGNRPEIVHNNPGISAQDFFR